MNGLTRTLSVAERLFTMLQSDTVSCLGVPVTLLLLCTRVSLGCLGTNCLWYALEQDVLVGDSRSTVQWGCIHCTP